MIVNTGMPTGIEILYWRERGREVDYLLRSARDVVAVEVTTARTRDTRPGLDLFTGTSPRARARLAGSQGIPLEEYFLRPAEAWLT